MTLCHSVSRRSLLRLVSTTASRMAAQMVVIAKNTALVLDILDSSEDGWIRPKRSDATCQLLGERGVLSEEADVSNLPAGEDLARAAKVRRSKI